MPELDEFKYLNQLKYKAHEIQNHCHRKALNPVASFEFTNPKQPF